MIQNLFIKRQKKLINFVLYDSNSKGLIKNIMITMENSNPLHIQFSESFLFPKRL